MDSTKGNLSMTQRLKFTKLITKAYSKEDKPFPMERPNVNQTWTEWIALYKTFIKTTGNVYIYCLAPEDGVNKGKPVQVYLLPSHLMQIVVKDNVDFLTSENPIKEYILTEGASYIEFDAEKVIHIKYSNPNYDENGAHLYGISPLRAALKNIQNSNTGLDLNIKTLKSGGAFGLIHAKSTPLTEDQAKSIKDRLLEMDSSPDRLSKIAGVSAEVGFTRLSLTSDELKPFDYLAFDRQQIADCLIWELVDSNRGDFGGTIEQLRKQRVTDNIQPDLKLLTQALNEQFLPRFKGYENAEIIFDIMELPEMQTDVKELTEWLNTALDRGVINRNEYRNAIHYLEVDEEDMTRFTVTNDIISLEEALDNDFNIADQPAKQRRVKAGFDPNQPRAADGRWGSVAGDLSKDELEFAKTIKDAKIEYLGYFCGGEKRETFTGTATKVTGSGRDLTEICKEFSTIHNHPTKNLAMSWGDLKTFVTSGDDKMIIVAGDRYLIAEKNGDFDWSLFMGNDSKWGEVREYYDTLKSELYWEYSKQYKLVEKTADILGFNETQIAQVAKNKSHEWFMQELIKNNYLEDKIKLTWNIL
jgi:HK97 family phage portal protein